jgi:hypothetical protein
MRAYFGDESKFGSCVVCQVDEDLFGNEVIILTALYNIYRKTTGLNKNGKYERISWAKFMEF